MQHAIDAAAALLALPEAPAKTNALGRALGKLDGLNVTFGLDRAELLEKNTLLGELELSPATQDGLPRLPSEYFAQSCFVGATTSCSTTSTTMRWRFRSCASVTASAIR